MDALLALDTRLFVLINQAQTPALDWAMPWITQFRHFAVFLAALWLIAFWKGERGTRIFLLALLAAVGVADLLASHVIKPLVGRTRPCHVVEPVRLFFSCKQSFSFPSSHTVNIACAVALLGARWRRLLVPGVILALAVGYSRIYVGLHYPLDALGGYVLGTAIGIGTWVAVRKQVRGGRAGPSISTESG